MGARQSSEERRRSNSLDSHSLPNAASLSTRNASTSVVSTVDILNSMRLGGEEESGSEEERAGPSRPVVYPRDERLSHLSSHHRRRLNHSNLSRRSVPLFLLDINCPVCHKRVASDDADIHLVMCLTRPKITYNEDILVESKGECCICLEEMEVGCRIARLPCLCIYHKDCIDDWFKRKNCCPEHPGDD